MTGNAIFMAATSWPDAAVAIAGVALVGTVVVVIIWQALATWRTRIAVTREEAYRRLAEQTARDLQEVNERITDLGLQIGDIDRRLGEREEGER